MIDGDTDHGPSLSRQSKILNQKSKMLSLHVLDLFLDPVDPGLDLDDGPADGAVVALRADGVRLAKHLLGNEVARPAGRLVAVSLVDDPAELIEVAGHPRELLADV